MKTLLILLLLSPMGLGATYYVPDHFSKIQLAISDSSVVNGDVIIVRDGQYHESLNYLGKEITVTTENGPDTTILIGNGANPVVKFANGEGASTVIEGFTITNGDGVYIPSANGSCGGGILCRNTSSPVIKGNRIVHNFSYNNGGGVAVVGDALGQTSALLKNNIITNNSGGGVFVTYGTLTIQDTVIDSNQASGGAGVYVYVDGILFMENSILSNNYAKGNYGGGVNVFTHATSAQIHNCLFYNNEAQTYGGGVYVNSTPLDISSCTFYGNSCINFGGGLAHSNKVQEVTVTNCIFWANRAAYAGHEQIGRGGGNIYPVVTYCNVQGGYTGNGNMDQDPLFTGGPEGFYYLSQVAAGDLIDSPCVDSGSASAVSLGMDLLWTRTDEVGDSGTVDMGFHYGHYPVPSFLADKAFITESAGGVTNFRLQAGPTRANKNYMIMASFTGNYPGVPLPGWTHLPLNWDILTNCVIRLINTPIFSGFMGQLNASGEATAVFNTFGPLPAGSAGITLHFAYALENWEFVSNTTKIAIIP